jgi:hypothetical protein
MPGGRSPQVGLRGAVRSRSLGESSALQHFVAHSWSKRRLDDWLIYDEGDLRQGLLMRVALR